MFNVRRGLDGGGEQRGWRFCGEDVTRPEDAGLRGQELDQNGLINWDGLKRALAKKDPVF